MFLSSIFCRSLQKIFRSTLNTRTCNVHRVCATQLEWRHDKFLLTLWLSDRSCGCFAARKPQAASSLSSALCLSPWKWPKKFKTYNLLSRLAKFVRSFLISQCSCCMQIIISYWICAVEGRWLLFFLLLWSGYFISFVGRLNARIINWNCGYYWFKTIWVGQHHPKARHMLHTHTHTLAHLCVFTRNLSPYCLLVDMLWAALPYPTIIGTSSCLPAATVCLQNLIVFSSFRHKLNLPQHIRAPRWPRSKMRNSIKIKFWLARYIFHFFRFSSLPFFFCFVYSHFLVQL